MFRTIRPGLWTLVFHAPLLLHGQLLSDADAIQQMRNDVRYLASDRLEGREAGTEGERLAAEYIVGKYGNVGLMPYGDNATYLQAFDFLAPPVRGKDNVLQLGRRKLRIDEDYYPISLSGSGVARGKLIKVGYGIHAPDLGRDDFGDLDLRGRVAAMLVGSPDGIHPHSKFIDHHPLRGRIEQAIARGAVGVVLYNDDPNVESPDAALRAKVQPVSVPVVFLKGEPSRDLLEDNNPCVITADILREQRTAYNVVGMLDNGRDHVVVIGAHYDHLGWGHEGSRHRGEKAIHYGADDNASGVAVLLQLARDLAEMDEARGSDYLFIAFSGEEKGLYGSNHWTKNPTVPLQEINYMINLDMVGRLDSTGNIGINGVGTSPAWGEVERILVGDLKVKTTASGIGSSDHTSFYLQGIPAIHFFTGTHEDYHKPGDTWEKINYEGMLRITRYIESLITTLQHKGKLEFTKTEEADSTATPRFKVTMGVVPDYMYSGQGMRIDGVTEGKPAANAGLKQGDIVVRIGQVEVPDMMGYMKALGRFNKGDTAPVKILREGKEVMVEVTF
jgi:hypothetical protein